MGTIVNDDVIPAGVPLRLFPGRNLIGGPCAPVAVRNILYPHSILLPGSVIGWNPMAQEYITNVLYLAPL